MINLMCIRDTFTKEWQGFHYSRSCMAINALRSSKNTVLMALNGSTPKDLVLMTDNGPQYISNEFRGVMSLLGIKVEYIQKHTPEDNRDIESFHKSIKTGYVWPNKFMEFHDASITIGKTFPEYNEYRSRSSFDYPPPREFKRKSLDDPAFGERFAKNEVKATLDDN